MSNKIKELDYIEKGFKDGTSKAALNSTFERPSLIMIIYCITEMFCLTLACGSHLSMKLSDQEENLENSPSPTEKAIHSILFWDLLLVLFIFFTPKPAKPQCVEEDLGWLLYSARLFAHLVSSLRSIN
jgi:hypothetical protein